MRTRTLHTGGFPKVPDPSWSPATTQAWRSVRDFADSYPSNRPGGWNVEHRSIVWPAAVWVATWPIPVVGILVSDTLTGKWLVIATWVLWQCVVGVWAYRDQIAWEDVQSVVEHPVDVTEPAVV